MEKRISELLSELEPDSVEIECSNIVSVEKIKEMTMKKIRDNKTSRPRVGRAARIGLIAAVLGLALAIGAGAYVGFVHYADSAQMLDAFFGEDEYSSVDMVAYDYKGEVASVVKWESVPVNEEVADRLINPYISQVGKSMEYKGYTVTVEACYYDGNIGSGLLYYTIENPAGVGGYALQSNGEIWWPGESPIFAALSHSERSYIDTANTTDTKLYVCAHFVILENWGEFELRFGMADECSNDGYATLPIELYESGVPGKTVAGGMIKLSPIGLCIDRTLVDLAASEAMGDIIIRNFDGSEYVVQAEGVSNWAYAINNENIGTYLFNRIVDIDAVTEISINGTVFTIE